MERYSGGMCSLSAGHMHGPYCWIIMTAIRTTCTRSSQRHMEVRDCCECSYSNTAVGWGVCLWGLLIGTGALWAPCEMQEV